MVIHQELNGMTTFIRFPFWTGHWSAGGNLFEDLNPAALEAYFITMAHDLEIARSRAAISRVRQQLEMVAKEQLFHAVFASPSHSLAPSWLVLSQTPPLLGDWVSHLPEQPVRPEQPLGCP